MYQFPSLILGCGTGDFFEVHQDRPGTQAAATRPVLISLGE